MGWNPHYPETNRPLHRHCMDFVRYLVLLGRTVHSIFHPWTYHPLVLKFSSFMDVPSTSWTNFLSFMDDPSTLCTKIFILHGCTVHFMDYTIFIFLWWSVHFMDLIRLFPFVDDPSTLWTWSFHPLWVTRPLYGLELFILFWMVRPLYGFELFILLG